MSFLGFGNGQPQLSSEQKIAAAETELDLVTDMFNKLVDNCYKKCISTQYAEGTLSKGESACLDRCVAKYFETNVKVGENMQQLGQTFTNAGKF
ncbi:protein transporter [Maudiozyma humilis]|uniref:Mitochondrial import inner membrane translocase subunit n=1 Tax=Maudiozyma humilis TaxID=51915 RepID=A0AAV5S1J1_MAUHU|nr:protein transporter [Kazachstania humilis]